MTRKRPELAPAHPAGSASRPVPREPLHADLERLARGESPASLAPWVALAASALRRAPGARDPDAAHDLAQQALEKLLRLSRNRPGVFRGLLARDEAKLRASLRTLMVRLVADLSPGSARRKALSALVKRALADRGLPPAAAPSRLEREGHDRLDHERVRAAVGWALSRPDAPPRRTGPVTRYLLDHYFPLRTAVQFGDGDGEGAAPPPVAPLWDPMGDRSDGLCADDPELCLRREIDGERLARALLANLTPRQTAAFSRFLHGEKPDGIAVALCCSTSAVRRDLDAVARLLGIEGHAGMARFRRSSRGTVSAALRFITDLRLEPPPRRSRSRSSRRTGESPRRP